MRGQTDPRLKALRELEQQYKNPKEVKTFGYPEYCSLCIVAKKISPKNTTNHCPWCPYIILYHKGCSFGPDYPVGPYHKYLSSKIRARLKFVQETIILWKKHLRRERRKAP